MVSSPNYKRDRCVDSFRPTGQGARTSVSGGTDETLFVGPLVSDKNNCIMAQLWQTTCRTSTEESRMRTCPSVALGALRGTWVLAGATKPHVFMFASGVSLSQKYVKIEHSRAGLSKLQDRRTMPSSNTWTAHNCMDIAWS